MATKYDTDNFSINMGVQMIYSKLKRGTSRCKQNKAKTQGCIKLHYKYKFYKLIDSLKDD